jgi:hypothetical protein
MSRNARTPAPRSRRIALGFGTAAVAAVVATSLSMGTAPVAGADVSDADAVSALAGALDLDVSSAASVADAAADAAETVPEADAISYLIDAFDPDQFTSTGAPAGLFGLLGYFLDTYFFGPNAPDPSVDAFLEPYVLEIVSKLPADAAGAVAAGGADPVSDVIGALDPSAFNAFDSVIDGLVGSSTLF